MDMEEEKTQARLLIERAQSGRFHYMCFETPKSVGE